MRTCAWMSGDCSVRNWLKVAGVISQIRSIGDVGCKYSMFPGARLLNPRQSETAGS